MAEASYGNVTAKPKGGGGEGDPNVLQLKEASKIRLLEPTARKWRQHFIESASDPEQGRSVVCPKGPDGRDNAPCPLCMKPVDESGNQRFSVSRRFATNVWDYDSKSVKILVAGPQVFEEFDAAAAMGLDPMGVDYLIHKMGSGKQTSYKVLRGDASPAPTVGPDDMHDLSKFDTPHSPEQIFEKLEEMGIDYDSLENPSFTLEEAESFVMPYGKHKGMTVEQLVANDDDYAQYMHRMKLGQGSLGDPVFVALHVVLENRGFVEPLEDVPEAPPRPASAPAAEAPAESDTVTLVGPDGVEVEVPAVAKDAMLSAGYTEPSYGEDPTPEQGGPLKDADGNYILIKDGQKVSIPEAALTAMLAQGYEHVTGDSEPEAQPEPLPADTDQVVFHLKALPAGAPGVPMAFSDAKRLYQSGDGTFEDESLGARIDAATMDKQEDREVAAEAQAAAAADPTPPGGTAADPYDPGLTEQREDGRWTHPAIPDKDYAGKGGVTQALNKLRKDSGAPAPAAAASNGASAHDDSPALKKAKDLLAGMPEIQSDFNKLLEIFQEVAGKRNITDFTEPELEKLCERLEAEKASA